MQLEYAKTYRDRRVELEERQSALITKAFAQAVPDFPEEQRQREILDAHKIKFKMASVFFY